MGLNEKTVTEAERRLQTAILELEVSGAQFVPPAERRLQTVISELDTVDDFLEKGRFVLMELVEVSGLHVDDTPDIRTRNLNKANMLANIAYDYLTQAQSVITSLVLREGKARTDRSDPDPVERRQEIMRNIQQIKNPALLEKIQTFVKCWMDDEGGKADE